MKAINTKRWLSVLLVLCMAASLFVTPALAAQDVEATPGSGTIPVEYFTSTLYKWNEDGANDATATADWSENTTTYTKTTVNYNWDNNYNSYTNGNFYVEVNGTKYRVTGISCSRSLGFFEWIYSWKITYDGRQTTSNEPSITLYQKQGYEGKGFYFTEANNKPHQSDYEKPVDNPYVPDFSKWSGKAQNFHIYSGLAESNLKNATNAPFNNETVNAADLFSTTEYSWKNVYTNVKVPFKYNAETGYYTLNSDENAVYFQNGNAQSGATMVIADKPVHTPENSGVQGAGFQPFEKVSSRTTSSTKSNGDSVLAYKLNDGTATYGFGMVTQVPFQMTDNGKDADGDPIQFRFSGDDDVWVYIDDILVLDIGGTHDAITGTIDFSTGAVTLDALNYDKIGDKATHDVGENADSHDTSTLNQTNLYTALGKSLIEFASEGQHTLTIYYMDRGRGKTNCLIEFNLPQRDSVSVTKEISPNYTGTETQLAIPPEVMNQLNNIDFTFTLYRDGEVVPNQSYSLYEDGEFVTTGSTDRYGQFKLQNGQTATFRNISLDTEQSWYVKETNPGVRWSGSWTAKANANNEVVQKEGAGFTSESVRVTGSTTATDTIQFVFTNAYEYVSELSLNVYNETIVLDYGLPVLVDVLKNDTVDHGAIESVEITSGSLSYGQAIVTDDNKIEYTLDKEFKGIETITYKVTAKDAGGKTDTKSGTLTIIPATSVYYEENFGSLVTYKHSAGASWTEPTNNQAPYQETGFMGDHTDHTYGTDAAYLNQPGDSCATAMTATVTDTSAAQFEYDFTGTGTTIYGKISTDTGYIKVEVKRGSEIVDTQFIDTVVLENSHGFTELYNNPIYTFAGAFGTYHVRVYLYSTGTPTSHGDSGSEFNLDGIRIYNPMGRSEEDNPQYGAAQSAYAADGENNTVVVNIRQKLAVDGADGTFVTLTDTNGNLTSVENYAAIGPNEELYLNGRDYRVSFAVKNWDSQSYKMYLGLKAPLGTPATVKIGDQNFTVNNSTECYYDISSCIVTDSIDETISYITLEGVSDMVALTNIKVTGVDEYLIVDQEDRPGGDIPQEFSGKLLMMSVSTAQSMIDGAQTEEQPEETPVFTPDSVKFSCVYSRLLRVATVTVTTSKDVDYVTINGRTVRGVNLFGSRYFTRACTGISKGEELEIICYDADGVASDVYTVTAK